MEEKLRASKAAALQMNPPQDLQPSPSWGAAVLRPYKPTVLAGPVSIAGGQATQDFADAGEKSYTAQHEREPGPGVQAMIEEITNRGSNDNRTNESKRQLKRQRKS